MIRALLILLNFPVYHSSQSTTNISGSIRLHSNHQPCPAAHLGPAQHQPSTPGELHLLILAILEQGGSQVTKLHIALRSHSFILDKFRVEGIKMLFRDNMSVKTPNKPHKVAN